MEIIWITFGILSLILLVIYWGNRNSVWGGLTLGIIAGFVIALFIEFDWNTIFKSAISGTIIGFLADLLGKISDKVKNKKVL